MRLLSDDADAVVSDVGGEMAIGESFVTADGEMIRPLATASSWWGGLPMD